MSNAEEAKAEEIKYDPNHPFFHQAVSLVLGAKDILDISGYEAKRRISKEFQLLQDEVSLHEAEEIRH